MSKQHKQLSPSQLWSQHFCIKNNPKNQNSLKQIKTHCTVELKLTTFTIWMFQKLNLEAAATVLYYVVVDYNNTVVTAWIYEETIFLWASPTCGLFNFFFLKRSPSDSPLCVSWVSRPPEAASASLLLVFIPANMTEHIVKLRQYREQLPVSHFKISRYHWRVSQRLAVCRGKHNCVHLSVL